MTVIVTGASRGIGAAAALWLGTAGADVVLLGRRRDSLETVAGAVRDRGGRTRTVEQDMARPGAGDRAVAAALDAFGRLDGVLNNAGVLEPIERLADGEMERWRHNLSVNLLGPADLMRASIPALRDTGGRIVNISSGAARNPVAGWSAYCAAKAALTHLTAVAALEEPALTVVALRPGVVDTAMQADIRDRGRLAMDPEKSAYFDALHREGRLEPPWVPARSAAWLLLRAPRTLTGRFLEYDDPEIHGPATALLGSGPP
jgi:NAD(P)-dependent dehydrogenase (short-subunit alcohol dehydrogenase family)